MLMIDGDYKIGADYSGLDDVAELKPCPFCGGEAETDCILLDYHCSGVHCNNCGVYVFDRDSYGFDYDSEIAIEKWNRRTNEE